MSDQLKNRLDAARPDFYNNLFARQVSDNYFLLFDLKVARFESWSFAHQNLKEGKKSKEMFSDDLRVKITLVVVIMSRRQWRWLRRRCVRRTRPGRAVQWVIRGRLPKVGHCLVSLPNWHQACGLGNMTRQNATHCSVGMHCCTKKCLSIIWSYLLFVFVFTSAFSLVFVFVFVFLCGNTLLTATLNHTI